MFCVWFKDMELGMEWLVHSKFQHHQQQQLVATLITAECKEHRLASLEQHLEPHQSIAQGNQTTQHMVSVMLQQGYCYHVSHKEACRTGPISRNKSPDLSLYILYIIISCKNFVKDQSIFPLVVILFILITISFDDVFLFGENWYWWLLGLEGFIISILKSLVIPEIWLALSSVIYSRITLFFALNHICSKSHHSRSKSCLFLIRPFLLHIASFLFQKQNEMKKPCSAFHQTDWILWFQSGCRKVVIELCVVQFWSEIILVISNRTCTVCSSYFEITRLISDQIALHSVLLLLLIRAVQPDLFSP